MVSDQVALGFQRPDELMWGMGADGDLEQVLNIYMCMCMCHTHTHDVPLYLPPLN